MVSKLHPMDYLSNAKGVGDLGSEESGRHDLNLTKSPNSASPGMKPIGIRCFV